MTIDDSNSDVEILAVKVKEPNLEHLKSPCSVYRDIFLLLFQGKSKTKYSEILSLSIRPSYGGGGARKFLSFTPLPFSLPSFPFSPETPDTLQARITRLLTRLQSPLFLPIEVDSRSYPQIPHNRNCYGYHILLQMK